MTKNLKDLTNLISASGAGNASKESITAILTKAFSVVGDQLASGEEIRIEGFGTFSVKDTPERPGRNPSTGEAMTIKASRKPVFKAMPSLKNRLIS